MSDCFVNSTDAHVSIWLTDIAAAGRGGLLPCRKTSQGAAAEEHSCCGASRFLCYEGELCSYLSIKLPYTEGSQG